MRRSKRLTKLVQLLLLCSKFQLTPDKFACLPTECGDARCTRGYSASGSSADMRDSIWPPDSAKQSALLASTAALPASSVSSARISTYRWKILNQMNASVSSSSCSVVVPAAAAWDCCCCCRLCSFVPVGASLFASRVLPPPMVNVQVDGCCLMVGQSDCALLLRLREQQGNCLSTSSFSARLLYQ